MCSGEKTREERMHELLYSNDGRVELCEMILMLEDDLAHYECLGEYERKMDSLVCDLTHGLLSKSAATPNSVIVSTAEEMFTRELLDQNAELYLRISKLEDVARSLYKFLVIADGLQACVHLNPDERISFAQRMREAGLEPEE